MFVRTKPFSVMASYGPGDSRRHITNKHVAAAYERLADSSTWHGGERAEAFLRFVEKCAARGVRLYEEGKED